MPLSKLAPARQTDEFLIAANLSAAAARRLQRQAQAGTLQRIYKGIYVPAGPADEVEAMVRRQWQRIAGTVVPGGVVSHTSAMGAGLLPDNTVTLSHPTLFGRKVVLPGVTLVLLRGPGPLPGDLPIGNSGLHWAGRARMLLENLGRKAPRRAGQEKVETYLVTVLHASGERALNEIRDQAAPLAGTLGAQKKLETLRSIIGALLGTRARGELRTRDGQLMAQGTS